MSPHIAQQVSLQDTIFGLSLGIKTRCDADGDATVIYLLSEVLEMSLSSSYDQYHQAAGASSIDEVSNFGRKEAKVGKGKKSFLD